MSDQKENSMNEIALQPDKNGDVAVMTMFNTKAVVDALVYSFPGMKLAIALDENTVIPLQGAIVSKDKGMIVLSTNEVTRKLSKAGKGKIVFSAMTDAEKIEKIGE